MIYYQIECCATVTRNLVVENAHHVQRLYSLAGIHIKVIAAIFVVDELRLETKCWLVLRTYIFYK